MSGALEERGRTALDHFVQAARQLLERDLAREAEGRFGVHVADGTVEDETALRLAPTELAARREVVEILDVLRTEEGSPADASARLVRESAFTHLNRLVAIRIAESLALLPESLAKGQASAGFTQVLDIMPLLAQDASAAYWDYIQLCGDELAAELPQLFDPRNPLLALSPSPATFRALVTMIAANALESVWNAPDALGWAYQFFNSSGERRAMRDASPSPRTSRELAVRNQFFTPRYVVDFLVQNSLGRRLLEGDPSSPLIEHLPLLVDAPTERGVPISLEQLRILDPACGSGHFLIGAYDVLERAWEIQGVSAEESAPQIVASLWGVDIDPRCAQVAAAAVIFRARRHCRLPFLPRPNVVTARALPEPNEGWDAALATLPQDRRLLVTAIREALESAPVLGSLLKVEEALASEIHAHVAGSGDDETTLFGAAGLAGDAFGAAQADVLRALERIADTAESTAAERLLAAEAQDAFRFVEAMRHRYDVVLMNPPFGEPVSETKTYLKASYPTLPKIGDLLAPFVARGSELALSDTGYFAAITSRAALFLKSFEKWRLEALYPHGPLVMADFGYGVMEQALVEAAAYVLAKVPPSPDSTVIRLLRDADKPKALLQTIADERAGSHDATRVFTVQRNLLAGLPGAPMAYWLPSSVTELSASGGTVEGPGRDVRQGLATADNFRFLRCFWEVDPRRVASSREETHQGKCWVAYAKGGDYSPYWADLHLLVDWEHDGQRIKSHVDRQYPYLKGKIEWVVKNQSYYFRPGLTWPVRTASAFGPRVLPRGVIIGHQGNGIFFDSNDPESALLCLGWLCTRLTAGVVDAMVSAGDAVSSGGAARSYEVGVVQRIPWPANEAELKKRSPVELVLGLVTSRAVRDQWDETARTFRCPFPAESPLEGARMQFAEGMRRTVQEIETAYCAEEALLADVRTDVVDAFLDDEVWPHPWTYRFSPECDERIRSLLALPIDQAVDRLIEDTGGARAIANLTFVADRRVEVISHGLGVNPRQIVELALATGPTEHELRASAGAYISYAFGCAIGRWDLNMWNAEEPGAVWSPFDELPVIAPGRRQGGGAPCEVPGLGVLVDEQGHEWDVVTRLISVCDALFPGTDDPSAELIEMLGEKSVRVYLRSRFFKDHLSRYSKSRRKAPIYWWLSLPSKSWGVWVHAPGCRRETMYAVASEAARRERLSAAAIVRLHQEQEAAAGRAARRFAQELDIEERIAEELRRFRREAERIAALGWEPNLDDGVVLCAAPLADLFPAWPDAKKARDELRKGQHEWAAVARWAGEL